MRNDGGRDFCNIETSLKAKEKGFNGRCWAVWNDGNFIELHKRSVSNSSSNHGQDFEAAIPERWQLRNWLRESKNIDIVINKDNHGYSYMIESKVGREYQNKGENNSWQECLDKALLRSLDLI